MYFFFVNLIILFIYLFIFGCVGSSLLHAGFSLVVASGGCSSLRCVGVSLQWLLLLPSTALGAQASVVVAPGLSSCGSWALEAGSVVVAHGLSCSVACGIFPDQGSNPCPLHWQADS